jgi:raffinose/stachyose/melibiose transport system substrate-binding protein
MSLIFTFTSCGEEKSSENSKDKTIKITMINSKGEIQTQLEELAEAFTSEYKNIEIDVLTASTGQSPFERVTAMYASGEAPTISMLDGTDMEKFADKSLDLSDEKWVEDISFSEGCEVDGKFVAFPFAVEGCGLIYNKKVLDSADINPDEINTRTKLNEAFEKIEESGNEACVIGQMDWSLANHLSTLFIANKSKNIDETNSYISSLKEGSVNLKDDKDFNGFIETFNLLIDYNVSKDDPMSADYTKCAEYMCSNEVGFYYQGNWTWPEFENFDASEDNFGFMPLPVSDNEDDISNNSLQIGITKFAILDSTQNDESQQNAGKEFLNWIVYDTDAQKILVNDAKIIMAFENVKIKPQDPLGIGILDYMNNDKTMIFVANLVPSDHWKIVGPSYQKYLAGKSSKSDLISEIEKYWSEVEE